MCEFWRYGHAYVNDRLKVAVRILKVDKIIVVGWPGGSVGAFQWLKHLPEVLVVAERRVDGDRSSQHCGGNENLYVGAPDAFVVDTALVDVVRLRDGLVTATSITTQIVNDRLPHLSQRSSHRQRRL